MQLCPLNGGSSMRRKTAPKPEIVNFRVRWDRVCDVLATVTVWLIMLWSMVFMTAAMVSNLN